MKLFTLFLMTIFSISVYSQATKLIVKDLDGDKKIDSVYIDSKLDVIFCLLSTQDFKKIKSEEFRIMNMGCSVAPTKKGFQFWNHFDRSQYTNEFEYNKELKKIQLVKIIRDEYDGATFGQSTYDYITCEYVGAFTYAKDYDYYKDNDRRELPLIKTYLDKPNVFLESFDDYVNYSYEEECVELLNKAIEDFNE